MAGRHRKGKRLSQVDPSSIEDGTQGFNSWSQPLQNSDNDRGIPYANTWMNNVQDPNETTSTYSAWDGERTQQPLYQYVSGEQDATDMRAFDPQQNGFQPVMQQAMHPHYAERILDNELLPDARTQHRVGTSNTVEAQRHWSSTYDMESSVESTRNDTSRLDPWPQSPHAIENPLQGHEHDPNSALSSGFTTAQQSTQNADYSYELSGISPMIGTQDPGYVGNGSVELPFMGVDGTQTGANPDPWSPYQPPELSHLAQQSGTNHETYLGSFSGATSSTFGSDNLELGRQVVDGTQSYLSSHHVHNDGTNSGMLTRHPRHLHLHIPQEMVPAPSSLDPLFNCPTFFVRTATPPVVVSDTESSIPGHGLLSPKPESMTSDTHSCASDTSSPAAPSEVYCDIGDCCTTFGGLHRKGNLARHKRLKHSDRVYVCEDASCGRVFNRQDARLKHYRKHHQRLASPYIARPQTRYANREQYPDFMSSSSG